MKKATEKEIILLCKIAAIGALMREAQKEFFALQKKGRSKTTDEWNKQKEALNTSKKYEQELDVLHERAKNEISL